MLMLVPCVPVVLGGDRPSMIDEVRLSPLELNDINASPIDASLPQCLDAFALTLLVLADVDMFGDGVCVLSGTSISTDLSPFWTHPPGSHRRGVWTRVEGQVRDHPSPVFRLPYILNPLDARVIKVGPY